MMKPKVTSHCIDVWLTLRKFNSIHGVTHPWPDTIHIERHVFDMVYDVARRLHLDLKENVKALS